MYSEFEMDNELSCKMKAFCLLLCLALARDIAGSIFRKQNYPQSTGIFWPVEYNDYQQQLEKRTQNQRHRYNSEKQNVASASREQQQRENWPDQLTRNPTSSSESRSQETRETLDYDLNIKEIVSPVQAANYFNSFVTADDQDVKPYGDVITWRGMRIATDAKSPREDQEEIKRINNDVYDTIEKTTPEEKKRFHEVYEAAAKTEFQDAQQNATQLLKQSNYDVEEHVVKTDDGYYLTLFRILSKQNTMNRPVVFLMHGMLGSADDWLLMGPEKSLAYLLSDAGYDVWLGNARGNKYSRRHASKHPAQKDFWQFSNDQIALNDLPAMIDYVLNTTNQEKMFYVGHSQGTTVFFALAAEKPEYNEKIIKMYALAPMAYMKHARSPLLRMMAPNSRFYDRLHRQIGHGEFRPTRDLIKTAGGDMCEKKIGCRYLCSNVNYVMSGVNVQQSDIKRLPVIISHLPAGASTRQMKQYGQAIASGEFQKYDFGAEINQKVYGRPQPTSYKMKNVRAPVELYYSAQDWLAHPEDVERLKNELPNVEDSYKVPEKFTHMDFQFSDKANVVNKKLIESMQKIYPAY